MKKFKFDLEDILELRQFKEDECMLALGQAISVLNKIESDIKETALKRHAAVSQRFVNLNEAPMWENYILRLEREAEQLMEKAAKAQLVVDEKRALYLEAEKEVKIMEELKEIQRKEYRKEMLVSEGNEVDDLTSARESVK